MKTNCLPSRKFPIYLECTLGGKILDLFKDALFEKKSIEFPIYSKVHLTRFKTTDTIKKAVNPFFKSDFR